jgi:hypothetical protein
MIADRHLQGRRLPLAVLLIWLLCAIALLIASRGLIPHLDFRDPDDALRLVQVRDWMAGQSWFDVTQYRINPPDGGAMHWSRLLDVPIATLLWLLTPIAGQALAESIVLALYPLLILGLLFGFLADAVRRLAGPVVALFAVLLLAVTFPVLIQLQPLRIDHHGWQIVMAALALDGSLMRSARRSGIVTGTALALWLHISSEALPYAALFGALYGLRYLRHAEQWDRLSAYLLAVTIGSTALLLGTHGWPASLRFYCDAMSPTFLIPLWTATLLVLPLKALLSDDRLTNRLAITGLAGAGALVALSLTGRECLAGPFETLDPYVYRYWYLNIKEGLPIWQQGTATVVLIVTGPILGLLGYGLALREQWGTEKAARWLECLFLAFGAFLVSVMVLRAMAVGNLFMLPGNAWLLFIALRKARAIEQAIPRILATVATVALVPALPTALASTLLPGEKNEQAASKSNKKLASCVATASLQGLNALPAAPLFAALDIGPFLLANTHHSVIATNHHRNQMAMAKVLRAFAGDEADARRIIAATPARYLVYCPERAEIDHYVKRNPKGLAARLEAGKPPVWLTPVPMRTGETIRVYRIAR